MAIKDLIELQSISIGEVEQQSGAVAIANKL